MKYIQLRKQTDKAWAIAASIIFIFWLIGLQIGEIYMPSKYSKGVLYRLSESPDSYWSGMNFYLSMAAYFLHLSLIEYPRLNAWHRRLQRKVKKAEENKPKRSLLWLLLLYGLVPIGIICSIFFLLAYFEVR